MRQGRKGFTLTELLVVIAIIGVLAVLLLTVVKSSRAKAKMSNCRGNLAGFSRSIDIYLISWDRKYPPYLSNTVDFEIQTDWGELAPAYFICPADWKGGEEGGVPDKVKRSGKNFMQSQQFKETDDTESNTTSYTAHRNKEVKACSYLYQFCIAKCSHPDAENNESWREYSERVMKEGSDGKVTAGHVPIVRCFWHATQKQDGSDFIEKEKNVLNIGVGHRGVFNSSRKWEDDLGGS